MRPKHLSAALATCMDAGQPAFVWGPPGIGKSDIVRALAKSRGAALVDIRAALMDPVDMRGIPHVREGATYWAPCGFLPTRPGPGIIFADELNAAPPMTQAAWYQLILDRALGEYRLPDGWTIFAAGNRETDRAVVHRMPSALANRFLHLEAELHFDDWREWALGNDIATEVLAFLSFKSKLLHEFDPQQKAFPTPRSWAFVSRLLKSGMPKECELDMLSGTVGKGAASELVAFLRVFRGLPSPDAILMDPKGAAVPKDPATLYALSGSLAARADRENFEAITTYCNRLPPEFAVLTIKDAAVRDNAVCSTRAFIAWAAKNKEVLV